MSSKKSFCIVLKQDGKWSLNVFFIACFSFHNLYTPSTASSNSLFFHFNPSNFMYRPWDIVSTIGIREIIKYSSDQVINAATNQTTISVAVYNHYNWHIPYSDIDKRHVALLSLPWFNVITSNKGNAPDFFGLYCRVRLPPQTP